MDLWLPPHDARVRALRADGMVTAGRTETPFGQCFALASEGRILSLQFMEESPDSSFWDPWCDSPPRESAETSALLERALRNPLGVPILAVGTPFRLSVWEFLRTMPESLTLTYGEVARAIGRPGAARAVGQAVGANVIALLIPCHRVVGKGGLAGYRWGRERKRALLAWELSRRNPLTLPF